LILETSVQITENTNSTGVYGLDTRGRLRVLINHDAELAPIVHDVKLLLGEKP
jgi:protein SCO1/2